MESNNRKKKGWIKLYPVKWLLGSTRGEMTNAQRAVWIDFLALAYLNDPPGQIDFSTYGRLAKQISISSRLLKSTINEAMRCKKIELVDTNGNILEPCLTQLIQKEAKKKMKRVKGVSNGSTIDNDLEKVDNAEKTIMILKWNEYQSEYLRQKPYRQRKSEEEEVIKSDDKQGKRLQPLNPEVVTKVTLRGEERRREEIRGEEIREDKSDEDFLEDNEIPLENHPPSNQKPFTDGKTDILQEYLSRLGNCPGYPLDDYKDTALFRHIEGEYPGIDILRELDKKISWWNEHPEALETTESPRQKLVEWFEKEYEFQNREDQ